MNILINCTNLKVGGGLQVSDSICCQLDKYPQHQFIVVLSSFLAATAERIKDYRNVTLYQYNIKNNLATLLLGRDSFLDGLVEEYQVGAVLTVFGPSRWNPKVTHLSGFAFSHLVLHDSPYFSLMPITKRIKNWVYFEGIVKYMLKRSTRFFWTENPMISEKVGLLFKGSEVYSITNYYNQVFDHPEKWKEKEVPAFRGCTLLTVTAAYPHKNLPISIEIAKELKQKHPEFKFRFVFTIEESQFPTLADDLREHFVFTGKVDITECPSLYRQADIMFQPTLLECFTATYPEAMKMEVPIVTTDLVFAHGLCSDASAYYSPLNAADAAEVIYRVATDEALRTQLVEAGRKQLLKFDTYEQRAEKLVELLEKIGVQK